MRAYLRVIGIRLYSMYDVCLDRYFSFVLALAGLPTAGIIVIRIISIKGIAR